MDLEVKNLEGLSKEPRLYSEGFLRKKRYREFESTLDQDSVLLLAHHLDDQIETLLLRLNRGAGMRGLSGIPERRSLGERFNMQTITEF